MCGSDGNMDYHLCLDRQFTEANVRPILSLCPLTMHVNYDKNLLSFVYSFIFYGFLSNLIPQLIMQNFIRDVLQLLFWTLNFFNTLS